MSETTLAQLEMGKSGVITEVLLRGAIRRRYYDIGCIRGAEIRPVGEAPFSGPRAYSVCGALIAIRQRDAAEIRVRIDQI